MEIEVDYLKGMPNMKIRDSETGEEIAVVLVNVSLPPADRIRIMDHIAELLSAKLI